MKKKKFSKLLILFFVVLFSGCTKNQNLINQKNSINQNQSSERENIYSTSSPEQEKIIKESEEKTNNVVEVVNSFMIGLKDYLSSTETSNSIDLALNQLSEEAKKNIPVVNGKYQLEQFLKIKKTPLKSYEITAATFSENPATSDSDGLANINVVFRYSQEEFARSFLLSKNETGWKIDGVELQEKVEKSQ